MQRCQAFRSEEAAVTLRIDIGTTLYDERGREYVVKIFKKDSKRHYYTCSPTRSSDEECIFIVPTCVWMPKSSHEKEDFIIAKKTRNRLRKILKTV